MSQRFGGPFLPCRRRRWRAPFRQRDSVFVFQRTYRHTQTSLMMSLFKCSDVPSASPPKLPFNRATLTNHQVPPLPWLKRDANPSPFLIALQMARFISSLSQPASTSRWMAFGIWNTSNVMLYPLRLDAYVTGATARVFISRTHTLYR